MAGYTCIMDVGNSLVNIIREGLSPDIIPNADLIGLCSPDEKGDMVLGIHLYDIRENEDIRGADMVNVSAQKQKYPSTYLSLYYMITAFSKADVKFKAGEDQRILGRVIQILSDNPVVYMNEAQATAPSTNRMEPRVRMLNISVDEKQKLWHFPNTPYKTSLFYKVSPLEIESERIKEIRRVVQADIKIVE